MGENKEALQELFKFFSEHPELLEKIVFTVRPDKLLQSDKPKDDKDKS